MMFEGRKYVEVSIHQVRLGDLKVSTGPLTDIEFSRDHNPHSCRLETRHNHHEVDAKFYRLVPPSTFEEWIGNVSRPPAIVAHLREAFEAGKKAGEA